MDKIDKIVAENQDVWKTRSQFFTWMKGVIRKGWTKHPVRTKKLDAECVMIENTNPRSKKRYPFVKGNKCEICGGIFKREFIETDHILEETAKLTEIEHIQECVEKLLIVCAEDTRILCKDCHEIVSYSQKKGITFDEAILEKKVIAFGKLAIEDMKNNLTNHPKYDLIKADVESGKKLTKKKCCELYRTALKGDVNGSEEV